MTTSSLEAGGSQRCLRGIFILCGVICTLGTAICFYRCQGDNQPSKRGNQSSSTLIPTLLRERDPPSPTNQVKLTDGLTEADLKSLSSVGIQINSTHVNGKLLEPVDIKWDRNIYFSVKTTTKYFKERLSALIPTWFQVVNKKMVSFN